MSWLGSASGVRLQSSTPGTPQTGNINLTGTALFGNGATSAGFISFYEDSDNGTNTCKLIGPASCADITVTLPASTGTLALISDVISLASITTTPTGSTVAGAGAAPSNSAANLTAYGYQAAAAQTTGIQNVAIGYQAGASWTDAHNNVAIGWKAVNLSNGVGITAVGGQAMQTATAASYSTAVGCYALSSVTGENNTATGYASGLNLTSGTNSVLIGDHAGDALTTTHHNTAVGSDSLGAATGTGGVAVGSGAASRLTSGDYNTAVGYRSLFASGAVGNNNVAVGGLAGTTTAGANGTYVGYAAGYTNTLGGGVYLGYAAGYYETAANKLFIDNLQRASESDGRAMALVYGIFDAARTNQYLTVNGHLGATVELSAATGNEIAHTFASIVNKATSGNDTTVLIKHTDTATPGTSLVLDIQSGAAGAETSKFSVSQAGNVVMLGNLFVPSSTRLLWSGTSTPGATYSVGLDRIADGVLGVTTTTTGVADGRMVARNYMVQLTADAVVQVGNVVMPDAGTDGRFDLNTGSATSAIGVLGGAGASAQGTAYNIIVDGLAYITPTTGTAVTRGHYMVMSATAGYVDDSATLGAAGLTIGKALCSEAMYTAATADVNLTNDTFKLSSAPGWAVNDPVIYYNGGGASATGLTSGNTYWIQSITTNTITVSATRGGSKIDITGTGNDAQYFLRLPLCVINIQ